MLRFTLAFVAGVLLFQYQPRLPHVALFGAYLLLGLCALPLRCYRLPAWLVCGFAWAHAHAWLTAPAPLPALDMQRPVMVEGRVDSLVDATAARRRFLFRVQRLAQDGMSHEGNWRLRVSWYRDAPPVQPGETWRLLIKLKPVSSYANPGSHDFSRWLYARGVRSLGSVRANAANVRLRERAGWSLTALRQRLSEAMAAQVPAGMDARSAALLRALVVGDRAGFVQSEWRVFRATGTNHLVAISGLHVGLVAGLVLWGVSRLWRRLPWLCSRWPALQAGAVAAWLSALLYAGLAGFAIPTQRALLMLTVAVLALLSGRLIRIVDGLALALLLVVAWSPMAVTAAGLWLSFAAVALILWAASPGRSSGIPLWQRWGRVQMAVGLGLFPLLILQFQQASLLAPLVNLLAIPWFSLLLVPLALLASLVWLISAHWGAWLWHAWHWLAQPALDGLAQLASWHWVETSLAAPQPLTFILAALGVALLTAPRGIPGRGLGALLLLPLVVNRPPAPAPGSFQLTLLDVGQGLAAVIRTHGHVLVYDAGPRYPSGFNTGDAVLLPYLRQAGVSRLDTLIVSHADSDHAGGAAALRGQLPIGKVLSGEPAEIGGTDVAACRAGQQWHWDGVDFTMLGPLPGLPRQGNNASCVLRVSTVGGSLLLTGDMEAKAEHALLQAEVLEQTTVVLVPHHGSRSSSTAAFIARLRPRHVLYATGRYNRWGFPKRDVMARWRALGATAWDTAVDGAVRVHFPADRSVVRLSGHRRRHYWNP
jgi:competence protein ComEC